MVRAGHGFDVHKLVEDRKLILCGVEIPYEKGLLGHSDADVLIHAICDSILGAAAKRDIGYHFSDKDPAYKDISSLILLNKCKENMLRKGDVNNVVVEGGDTSSFPFMKLPSDLFIEKRVYDDQETFVHWNPSFSLPSSVTASKPAFPPCSSSLPVLSSHYASPNFPLTTISEHNGRLRASKMEE